MIEIDPELCIILKTFTSKKVELINMDFLNLENIDSDIIFGNLPYNISKKILIKIGDMSWKEGYFLIQEEVGLRISSPKNNYIKLLISNFSKISVLKIIPKEYFYPKPVVNGILLKMVKIKNPIFNSYELTTLKIFCNHFRKKLKTVLKLSDLKIIKKISFTNKRFEDLTISEIKILLSSISF